MSEPGTQPLFGKGILLTLTRGETLKTELERLGATVHWHPLIRIEPAEDYAPLDHALQNLDYFDWVVFSSTNAVEAVMSRLSRARVSWPQEGPDIAVVGPATLEACVAAGLHEGFVPERHDSIGLIEGFADRRPRTVLLPQSAIADAALAEGLEAAGHEVTRVVAYRPVSDGIAIHHVSEVLGQSAIDAVIAGSPSTVRALLAVVEPDSVPQPVVCLGETTAGACRSLGLEAVVVPDVSAAVVAAATSDLLTPMP